MKRFFSINPSCSNFVVLRLDFLETECTLLVDSGAEISIFKASKILPTTFVNTNDQCYISGINDHSVSTLGTATTNILLPNQGKLQHKFHLVDGQLPIPTDGILGRDFLRNYFCSINYDTWMLTGRCKSEFFEIPIHDDMDGNIFLPPRCEVFRRINIGDTHKTFLVKSNEIVPGVFISNSIIDSNNPFLKFLNTTNETVKVKRNFSRYLSDIENYEIFSFNKLPSDDSRHQHLLSELNLENTPQDVKLNVMNLCKKYQDIFALETDNLTCNNFYKQTINLTDNSPVYIKKLQTS